MSHAIPCPFCEAECSADFADNGIGEERCGPYCCDQCHATELHPLEFYRVCCGEDLGLDEEERFFGWRRGERGSDDAGRV
jgi:hypothetical protein